MKKKPQTAKVLVSRIYPEIGIKLMQKEGFKVTAWKKDRPMTQQELIEGARKNNALLCTMTENINKFFLNECKHLDIISLFSGVHISPFLVNKLLKTVDVLKFLSEQRLSFAAKFLDILLCGLAHL